MPVPSRKRNKGNEEATQRRQYATSQPLVDPFVLDEQEVISRCLSENFQQREVVRQAFFIIQLSLGDWGTKVKCNSGLDMARLIQEVSQVNRQLGGLKAEMLRLESDCIKLGGKP